MPCLNWTVTTSSRFNTKARPGSAVTSCSHCSELTSTSAPGPGRAVVVDQTWASCAFVPAAPDPEIPFPLVPPILPRAASVRAYQSVLGATELARVRHGPSEASLWCKNRTTKDLHTFAPFRPAANMISPKVFEGATVTSESSDGRIIDLPYVRRSRDQLHQRDQRYAPSPVAYRAPLRGRPWKDPLPVTIWAAPG